jgi:hypothetical protein
MGTACILGQRHRTAPQWERKPDYCKKKSFRKVAPDNGKACVAGLVGASMRGMMMIIMESTQWHSRTTDFCIDSQAIEAAPFAHASPSEGHVQWA